MLGPMAAALFIRHQALPGKRDEVRRVWERFVKPRAAANPAHHAYFYCYDKTDPDVILVYQQYPDAAASAEFMKGAWYQDYLAEVSRFVAKPPAITEADVMWAKSADAAPPAR